MAQSGPVQPPPKSRYAHLTPKAKVAEPSEDDEDDEELSSGSEELNSEDDEVDGSEADPQDDEEEQSGSGDDAVLAKVQESLLSGEQERPSKKRKRANKEELEDVYMQKIAREEAKEEAAADEERQKKRKTKAAAMGDVASESGDSDDEAITIPKHETLTETKGKDEDEIEKATRTVFLSNVSSEAITSKAAKKTLLAHLGSFLADLPDHKSQHPHKVESIRFRSTAFSSSLPKKAAFAKKEVMDATTKSTNAYAVYSTTDAARAASRSLNGTIVLGRHLRVDSVTHPAKEDHRRCVFVGNLGFVDDESALDASEGKKSNRPPSDVEEGLWMQFSKAGKVENVRVIRDSKTRVGKGIAYVQFYEENGVEAALQFNEQRYPPLLPRKLRVSRAKQMKRNAQPAPSYLAKMNAAPVSRSKGGYNPKVSEEQKSKLGRARAVLSKAGQYKTAESFVFEGHRASKGNSSGLKLKSKKKAGKPKGRSAKRGGEWKASGGKRKTD